MSAATQMNVRIDDDLKRRGDAALQRAGSGLALKMARERGLLDSPAAEGERVDDAGVLTNGIESLTDEMYEAMLDEFYELGLQDDSVNGAAHDSWCPFGARVLGSAKNRRI